MRLARRVCTALGEAYHVNGHEVTTSASIGIAIGPLDSEPADTLLKNADLALYRAKEDGRNTFRFFEACHGRGPAETAQAGERSPQRAAQEPALSRLSAAIFRSRRRRKWIVPSSPKPDESAP